MPFELPPAMVISYPFDKLQGQKIAKNISAIEWQIYFFFAISSFAKIEEIHSALSSTLCCNTYMLGGGLNYLGSCSKGRSMLRQLHIVQSLFGEFGDLGVFREEMWDRFEQGTTFISFIANILVFEKTCYAKIALVRLY